MKKEFEAPELTIVYFINDDIITSSGPGKLYGYENGDEFLDAE